MKRFIFTLAFVCPIAVLAVGIVVTLALAQTSPGFVEGAHLCANYPNTTCSDDPMPNPLSLNQAFMAKQDVFTTAPAGSTALSLLQTTDNSWTPFGAPTLIAATHGNQDAIIGFVVNDLPTGTVALPSGIIGYGRVDSISNAVFGVYGLGELAAPRGVGVAAEFTCRNNSGAPPSTTLPPDLSFGTAGVYCNGLQVTSGGTNNSSIGIGIDSEGGSSRRFNTAIYFGANACAQWCLYGVGGAFTVDSSGNLKAPTAAFPSTPTAAGGGGLYVCIDSTGTLYKKSSCP